MSIKTYHLLDFPVTGNLAGISLRMPAQEVEKCWGFPEEKKRIEIQDNPTYSYREEWRYSKLCIDLEFIENHGLSKIISSISKTEKIRTLINEKLNLDLDLPGYIFSPFYLREFLDERKIRYRYKIWDEHGFHSGNVTFHLDNHMTLYCSDTIYDGYEIFVYIWIPDNEDEIDSFGDGHPPTEEGYSDNYY